MAVAVAMGAFGAHGLKSHLTDDALSWWDTAVQYQVWHAVGLMLVGLGQTRTDNPWGRRAALSFLVGILLFSGSLYALALSGIRGLGAITPVGGLAFIVGWLCFALAFRGDPSSHRDER